MTPLDPEYKITKLIKKKEVPFSQEFVELANWIDKTYNVEVLNIIYDTIDNTNRPRLWIIMEYENDSEKLSSQYGFGTTKQLEMSAPFVRLISDRLKKHNTENIWIIIRSFERPAKQEARWAISKKEIETLESDLNLNELWKVYIGVNYAVTFFFFTNEQVKKFSTDLMKKLLIKKYFEILRRHDEFGYYQEDTLSIELESKENFEADYENSWFRYDRR
ncbi:hypothetical protein BH11BAC3_BH11BAC3_07700 [soil metagenome]